MPADTATLLRQYTYTLLPWQVGAIPAGTRHSCDSNQGTIERTLDRLLQAASRAPRNHVVLMGLADGRLAEALATKLPDDRMLTVVECIPQTVRSVYASSLLQTDSDAPLKQTSLWWMQGRHTLLCDNSLKALMLLLHLTGRTPDRTTMLLNPHISPTERTPYKQLQRLMLSTYSLAADHPSTPDAGISTTGIQPSTPLECNKRPTATSEAETDTSSIPSIPVDNTPFFQASGNTHSEPVLKKLSICAILHPTEPHLDDFFAQLPDAREVVILWDAETIPAYAPKTACTVRQYARPLQGNFAAQRNAVLQYVSGEWLFFIDGDERLTSEQWQGVSAIMKKADEQNIGGVLFPRQTYWPDEEHVLAGFGLWPDMQLRLLRACPTLAFTRPVHEVITGTTGKLAIAPALPIEHFSRLYKDEVMLAQKLQIFDAAAGHRQHRLNNKYPSLPTQFFRSLTSHYKTDHLLLFHQNG